MVSAMEAPYTIASLPKPLDAENGQIYATPVYSFRGLKKRKRHEVVVGVDGESLSIYNVCAWRAAVLQRQHTDTAQVQSQSLVASYAIPPQTSLCCPPCSVYVRKDGGRPAERYTFAALKESAAASKCKLVRFQETVGDSASFAAPVKTEVSMPAAPFTLEVLSPSASQAPQILTTYANGNTRCISASGTSAEWTYNGATSANTSCEYACLADLETARRGVLKARDDIVSAIASSGASSAQLVFRVARMGKDAALQVFTLRTSGLQSASGNASGMDLLETIALPGQVCSTSDTPMWDLNAASGLLFSLCCGVLTVYDMTNLTPQVQSKFGSATDPIVSFVRSSTSSAVTATANDARLYEAKYGSIQASVSLSVSAAGGSKKRKRTQGNGTGAGHSLVSTFSDVGLLVAVDGTDLVAMQLRAEGRDAKRARAGGSLLVDALGRGSAADASRSAATTDEESHDLGQWKSQVDRLVKEEDAQGLEDVVANDLTFVHKPSSSRANGLVNGHTENDDMWILSPASFDLTPALRHRAMYLLSKIFKPTKTTGTSRHTVRLALYVPNIIRWLAQAGLLTAHHVSQALPTIVTPMAVISAISNVDDGYQLLEDLLDFPIFIELGGVVEALRVMIESLDTPPNDSDTLALPAPSQANGDHPMANGTDDTTFEAETLAAEQELRHASSALQTGLEIRSEALRLIFARLRAFPVHDVKAALRRDLTHKELVFFIQILRIELAEGGWTSRYIDVGNDQFANRIEAQQSVDGTDPKGPSDQAIRDIAHLLICAIDAIGTSGWLVGLSGDSTTTSEILDSVRAEVSASLEGCLEAKTLERILSELEGYAADAERVAFSTNTGLTDVSMQQTALPLGCRAEAPKVRERSARDDQAPKSKLQIARERDMRVGKYGIDRIRI